MQIIAKLGQDARSYYALTVQQKIFLSCSSIFFAVIPPRVFLGIASDVMQIAIVIVPFVIAFMVMVATIDITSGLPTNDAILENISRRRENFSSQLTNILNLGLHLIVVTLVAKSVVSWIGSEHILTSAFCRFCAWVVGGAASLLLIKINDIRNIFGYLSVGADMAQRFRASRAASNS